MPMATPPSRLPPMPPAEPMRRANLRVYRTDRPSWAEMTADEDAEKLAAAIRDDPPHWLVLTRGGRTDCFWVDARTPCNYQLMYGDIPPIEAWGDYGDCPSSSHDCNAEPTEENERHGLSSRPKRERKKRRPAEVQRRKPYVPRSERPKVETEAKPARRRMRWQMPSVGFAAVACWYLGCVLKRPEAPRKQPAAGDAAASAVSVEKGTTAATGQWRRRPVTRKPTLDSLRAGAAAPVA